MMTTFSIPQLNPDTPLAEAFAVMLQSGRNGVLEVALNQNEGRLLEFSALREANDRGAGYLRDVMAHDRVVLNLDRQEERPPAGFEFAAFPMPELPPMASQGPIQFAQVLSDEALAQVFYLAPRIRICTGPNHHSSPPNPRNPQGNCGICGSPFR